MFYEEPGRHECTKPRISHRLMLVFTDFCSSTGIRGFSFISKSLCRCESIFWAISIVICAGLTVNDVANLITKFASDPTMTKVDVRNNQSIHLGTPTLCVDINIMAMNFGSVSLENSSTVKEYLEQFEPGTNVSKLLLYWLNRYDERRFSDVKLIKRVPQIQTRAGWSEDDLKDFRRLKPLVSLFASVISSIYRFENVVRHSYKMKQIHWGIRKPSLRQDLEKYYTDNKTSEAVEMAYNYMRQSNESLGSWVRTVGAFMCEMMFINVVATGRNESNGLLIAQAFNPCKRHLVTWLGNAPFAELGREVLCIRLDLDRDAFFFGDPEQSSYIFINNSNLFTSNPEVDSMVTIDLSGEPVVTTASQGLLFVEQSQQVYININIQGEFNEKPTPYDPCIEESLLMCRLRCRSRFIINTCDCRPLSYDLLKQKKNPSVKCGENLEISESIGSTLSPDKSPMKFSANFSADCWQMKSFYDPDMICRNRCIRVCNYIIWGRETIRKITVPDTDATVLQISVDPFIYPVIVEVSMMDWKSFMSSLGGNLSFWLGTSFLVLLHAIIYVIRIPLQLKQFAKRSTMSTTRRNERISNTFKA